LEKQYALVCVPVTRSDEVGFLFGAEPENPFEMPEQFRVIEVRDDAAHATEAMGTKPKFWYHDDDRGLCLFKEPRGNTGEDWAEKVSAELADLLGLPHAEYELALWQGRRGTISPTFVPEGGQWIPGNQLLQVFVPNYPAPGPGSRKFYRVSQHTVDAVFEVLELRHRGSPPVVQLPIGFAGMEGVSISAEVFTGYLMLDAWIGNTDRHHENWGWVLKPVEPSLSNASAMHLAPTFDHASSLGAHEPDSNREERLSTRDVGRSVERYVEKARSALYAKEGNKKALATVDAFLAAARLCPAAARSWLRRLSRVRLEEMRTIVERVPGKRISSIGIEFACKVLELNQSRLLVLEETLP